MRGLIITIALFLSAPALFASEQPLLARVTVYWASGGKGSDRYTRDHKCATGTRLRTGHCAVDPRHIPYGSRVVFPDGTALAAVDTGSAVKNRKAARISGRTVNEKNAVVVDRFFETKRQALTWANTHPLFMPVRVVPPNSRRAQLAPQPPMQVALNDPSRPVNSLTTNSLATPVKPQPATVVLPRTTARNPFNRLGR